MGLRRAARLIGPPARREQSGGGPPGDAEQAISLILGTCLAAILAGATAYGSGVNVGLGAERLELAERSAAAPSTEGPAS
jgi:hypothetical protein